MKLEKNMNKIPENIKEIIEPNFELLNNIQFASKFQYLQMKELISHQENEVTILKSKTNRLKELLRKSRIELDKCNEYQIEITKLREENKRLNLKLQIGDSMESRSKSSVIDISIESEDDKENDKDKENEKEDFISKMRKFSQNSKFNKINNDVGIVMNTTKKLDRNNKENLMSFNIQAESTNRSFRNKDRSMSMQISKDNSINTINNSSKLSNLGKLGMVTSTAGSGCSNNRYRFQFKPPSRGSGGLNSRNSSVLRSRRDILKR